MAPSWICCHCFFRGLAVAGHQAAGDFEVLLRGFFTRLEHAMKARRVDGERLFHEDVAAFVHGVFDMDGTERGRGGQQDHVARIERVDGLSVGIHADELAFRGNVDLLGSPVCGSRDLSPAEFTWSYRTSRLGSERYFVRYFKLPSTRSGKTSAMAQSFVGPLVLKAFKAAPVPRPPQPTRAILMVLFSPA